MKHTRVEYIALFILSIMVLLLVAMIYPLSAEMVDNRWESVGPEGGYINAISIDPTNPDTLYVGTNNGIYKSADAGITWSASNSGINGLRTLALLIDPTNTSTLYAGTENGVFKSQNGGASWTKKPQGRFAGSVQTMAMDPTNPQVIYAGYSDIYKTSDGGENWTVLTPLTNTASVYSLAVDPQMPSVLYAGAFFKGLFKSVNGGQTWTQLSNGLPANSYISQIVIHPTNPSLIYLATHYGVYKSTNRGESWSQVLTGWITHLVINRQNPTILYASSAHGAFKGINNGSSWNNISQGLADRRSSALANDPQNPDIVYLAQDESGILKSSDGGATWVVQQQGLRVMEIAAVALDPHTSGTLYAGANHGALYKSTTGGANWHLALPSLEATWICGRSALAIDPKTPATLYAGRSNGIYKSIDDGSNWTKVFAPYLPRCVVSLAIDPATPNNLYLGASDKFYKSTNGGANWTQITSGLPSNNQIDFNVILVDARSPATLYLGADSGVYKSTNSGNDWQAINSRLPNNTGVTILLLHPQTNTTIYAGTTRGLYISTNSGQSWETLPIFQSIVGLVIHPQKHNLFFAATAMSVYYSQDAGETWHELNQGLSTSSLATLNIDPVSPEFLYAGTASNGVFKVRVNDTILTDLTPTFTPTSTYTATSTPIATPTSSDSPLACYSLVRTHTGSGADPQATLEHSSGCASGAYLAGESITLRANPAFGWQVTGWGGADHAVSKALTNTLTMPIGTRTVTVTYGQAPAQSRLDRGCDQVTPTGGEQPGICFFGLVYVNGAPVAGVTVQIENAQGASVNAITTKYPDEARPYYRLSLSGPPLSVIAGQTIKLTVNYQGQHATLSYVIQPDSQQVDIVVPASSGSATMPIGTITYVSADSLNQGEQLQMRGMGQDTDGTPGIRGYRWVSDQNGELGTSDILVLPTSRLSVGVHQISFEVQDNEGDWSAPVVTRIHIAPPAQRAWTALLYLAGDFHDRGQLERRFNAVVADLQATLTNTTDVQVAGLWDGPANNDTRRFQLGAGVTASMQLLEEQAMDDPKTLTEFVRWGQQQFPAQHYYLAVANHGQAVQGIAWDTTSDEIDGGGQNDSASLTVQELAGALGAPDLAPIDVLHLDACSMNLLEAGFEVRNVADILIASQYLGWNYFAYADYLQKIHAGTQPKELAQTVVERYRDLVGSNGYPYTIAALKLERMAPTVSGIDVLAQALTGLVTARQVSSATLDLIWQQSGKFESNSNYVNDAEDAYVDLLDWSKQVQAEIRTPSIQAAADKLITELSSQQFLILASKAGSGRLLPQYAGGPQINLAYANGISIFYPRAHNNAAFDAYINNRLFSFTAYSQWPDFLIAKPEGVTDPPPPPSPPLEPLAPLDPNLYLYLPLIRR